VSRANPEARAAGHAFFASFLGWTLDAFDFFVLVFVVPAVAEEFHRSVADVAYTITLTLAMRPIGALIFGWMADRYGRRLPLMIDVLFYSIVEVCSGFAPDYSTFLALRVLYGIGMGGEWGVGASLAMEVVPAERRGLLSGLLQEGYAIGYLLAAAAYFVVFPALGWRALLVLGGAPALLVLYIRSRVPESPAWQRSRPDPHRIVRAVGENFGRLLYLTLFMTMLSLMSHGTQDMYPTFLEKERGLGPRMVATIAIIYNIGALAGGLAFGALSDRVGRRRAMVLAALGGALVIPAWIFARSWVSLAAGAFAMQFMVQGAWGIVPAHLTELSPAEARGLFPGLAYQLGVLASAGAPYFQARLAAEIGYANTLALIAAVVMVLGAVVIAVGRERAALDFALPER
jgi:SHS family lactate transporter-like MFS transporter